MRVPGRPGDPGLDRSAVPFTGAVPASGRAPSVRFAFSHPAHFIALGAGSGLARFAPGTFGTLAAWFGWRVLDPLITSSRWGAEAWWGLIAFALAVGTWAAHRTCAALNVADSGHVVIDEIVAFWIVLAMLPAALVADWRWQLGAFVLFRVLDIVKPEPIRWVEQRFSGGIGVMADDLVAAAIAVLVLAVAVRLVA